MLLPVAIAGGCKSMPPEGPGQWYIGKAEVTGDTKMFGAGGPTSIMFQLPQGTTNWIWRISTAGVTREARANMGKIAAEQVIMALDGKKPPRLINPEVWPAYRARFARIMGVEPEA